jgi:hypothetical protein
MDGTSAAGKGARLSVVQAHVGVWLAFACINAFTILLGRFGTLGSRAVLAVFDLGHLAAIAILGYGLLSLWPWLKGIGVLATLAVLGGLVGFAWLAPDFRNFAERSGRPELWRAMGVGAGMSVPVVAIFGRFCARGRWCWLAAALCGLAAALNHHVLLADYQGIHLLVTWVAATGATAALWGAEIPAGLAGAVRWLSGRRQAIVASVPLLSISLASLLVLPSSPVLTQANRTEGSILFPFLVALHGEDATVAELSATSSLRISPAFLESRDKLPPIAASEPSVAPPRPIVVLISIDAFRADLLQGEPSRSKLVRLSQLADRSVNFSQARSPGSTTRNSLGQLFASKYSAQLHWTVRKGLGVNLREDPTPRLSTLLGEAGFTTVFLSTYPSLTARHAIVGGYAHEQRLKSNRKRQRFPLSDTVVDAALEQLQKRGEGPTFLYMHWLDAHDPYDAAGNEGTVFERYLGEMQLCDRSLGRLIDGLQQRKLWERTVLVVTADHGEALGEHGIPHHGRGLYEALVRVPLIVSVPGVPPRHVRVPVSTLDIAPTLLDLVGLATPGEYMGQSLVGFLRGQTPKLDRPIALDESRLHLRGLVLGPYKIIDAKRRHVVEIYDLTKDPQEAHNLYGTMPGGEDQQLLGLTRTFFAKRDVNASANADADELPGE